MSAHMTQNLNRIERAAEWAVALVKVEQERSDLPYREAAKRVARRIQTTASEISRLSRGGLSRISINTFFALSEAFERDMKHEAERLEIAIQTASCARRYVDPAAMDEAKALLARAKALLTEDKG